MSKFKVLDTVLLLADMPDHGLFRGQVGVVVMELDDGVFEVEFTDAEGKTLATMAIPETDLLAIHDKPERE